MKPPLASSTRPSASSSSLAASACRPDRVWHCRSRHGRRQRRDVCARQVESASASSPTAADSLSSTSAASAGPDPTKPPPANRITNVFVAGTVQYLPGQKLPYLTKPDTALLGTASYPTAKIHSAIIR